MASLLIGISGLSLTPEESMLLRHSQIGGVILFTRNYQDRSQLKRLVSEIKHIRPDIWVYVDHEGGAVQRFREGFTLIPAAKDLGEWYEQDEVVGKARAEEVGFIMASELKACGLDMSFAPVLDLHDPTCFVLGGKRRCYSNNTHTIIEVSSAFIRGMQQAGMPGGVGKHFPGHGFAADTHDLVAYDHRSLEEIQKTELTIYEALIEAGLLWGVMPAHVVYPAVDDHYPAGFSRIWMSILRQKLHFNGKIFSDDLQMKGARIAGNLAACALAAVQAGCDQILLCSGTLEEYESVLEALEEAN